MRFDIVTGTFSARLASALAALMAWVNGLVSMSVILTTTLNGFFEMRLRSFSVFWTFFWTFVSAACDWSRTST